MQTIRVHMTDGSIYVDIEVESLEDINLYEELDSLGYDPEHFAADFELL